MYQILLRSPSLNIHWNATALKPLPTGKVMPTGWLRNQLRIQADGLSGHLDEFWPDIMNSKWIGGDAEGWERGPYWLDGFVPLAVLLNDEKLLCKVRRWMDYIIEHQHEDGWLGSKEGAVAGDENVNMDPWPQFVLFKAMAQWQEATGDSRIVPTMLRALKRIKSLLEEKPLESWAKMRWPDLALGIHWLYERTNEDWLLELAALAQKQGYNWRVHFDNFAFTERQPQWTLEDHVVNNAMAIKEPAVRFRSSGDGPEFVRQYINTLDHYHGQATGVFSGDESLAGQNPSQGTELCSVVEYMFSLETALAAYGEPDFADRLERIAFNALPATFKPDMWAHQYDQQANQIACTVTETPIYTNNSGESNLYGLEPNFGCCTANMHQGWPKFASSLWMTGYDDSLTALAWAPCEVDAGKLRITVVTNYPFEDIVQVIVHASKPTSCSLRLRIPGWAEGATVAIDSGPKQTATAGTFFTINREWHGEITIHLHFPMPVRTQTRYNGAVSIERGPLIFALNIREEWRQLKGEAPHADWEVLPTTPWNYALELDRESPAESLVFEHREVGNCPFSPDGAPILAKAKGRLVPEWGTDRGAAAPPPQSPVSTKEPFEELVLLPYGCTNLRMTELPTL